MALENVRHCLGGTARTSVAPVRGLAKHIRLTQGSPSLTLGYTPPPPLGARMSKAHTDYEAQRFSNVASMPEIAR
jgi:hypothetical protein